MDTQTFVHVNGYPDIYTCEWIPRHLYMRMDTQSFVHANGYPDICTCEWIPRNQCVELYGCAIHCVTITTTPSRHLDDSATYCLPEDLPSRQTDKHTYTSTCIQTHTHTPFVHYCASSRLHIKTLYIVNVNIPHMCVM